MRDQTLDHGRSACLPDEKVEEICNGIDGVVVAANYNCPGQVVISGEVEAVNAACEAAKAPAQNAPSCSKWAADSTPP